MKDVGTERIAQLKTVFVGSDAVILVLSSSNPKALTELIKPAGRKDDVVVQENQVGSRFAGKLFLTSNT